MHRFNRQGRHALAAIMLAFALPLSGGLAIADSSRHAASGQDEIQEATARFIVRAASVEDAATAVRAVGGTVTHELGIIRSVSAMLSVSQLRALRENPAIQRISADSNVRAMTL